MDYIIQWTTQIIIFIILAIIIDLIIPNNALEKYIRFVMGLILLLLFLQPILQLFQVDVQSTVEKTFARTMNQMETNYSKGSLENMIEIEKSEIELTQHAYILEEMAVQLKELAKEPLQEEFQVEIMTIDFLFENEEDFSYENLQEVIVYVGEEENKDREGVVNEVDEVVIGPEDKETEKDEIDKEEIISHLEEIWQLYDKKIVIEWEGGNVVS
ncbi:stage III sporulation protein AF [Cerasibacillus terrae]|uniref:Stage III sporulation protein AF n=1 Tax=Cerasibacillus terrae TaxID=2498845 RepID=A0A5C8P3Q7_9BACI|nr:stage III sporulation protein AF [Cerasibacillus terrae]TXL67944.1 stage III sporulation protein AF [Cerasibacillus terrae]